MDIVQYLPGKRRQTTSGWISFNAVCCQHNGENVDKRGRGGVKTDGENWTYHCFNCGFKASFVLGRSVSYRAKKLLGWLGVDSKDIELLSLESLRHKSITDLAQPLSGPQLPEFEDRELPESAVSLDPELHSEQYQYLQARHIDIDSYPFLVTPSDPGRSSHRVLIPFTLNHRIVGYTSRFLDNKTPKYISEQQSGYVFGLDLQMPDWQYMIVTEGVFDAISISGVATLHNKIGKDQAALIKQQHRRVIVVPDRDSAGLNMIDSAVEHGFGVSIPQWPEGCKDINDAVCAQGATATILGIVKNAMYNRIKIEMAKKYMAKQIA